MSIVDWLKMLSSLTNQEKENLSILCQEKKIKAWDILFNEQDEASAMYFLKEGIIEISRMEEWKKNILWNVQAEEILWEMALFWDSSKRMASATALTNCSLLIVLSFSIKELTLKHPELLEKIKTIINDRIISNKNIK